MGGHYFHGHYDEKVRRHIPYNQINLFQPFIDAMDPSKENDEETSAGPKRGAILSAISQTRPIPSKVTKALTKRMQERSDSVHMVNVLPYSKIELEHVIANYECIGVGKLRFDEGK